MTTTWTPRDDPEGFARRARNREGIEMTEKPPHAAAIRELVALDVRIVVTADTSMQSILGALVDAVPGVAAAAPMLNRSPRPNFDDTGVPLMSGARYSPEFRRNGQRITEGAMRARMERG